MEFNRDVAHRTARHSGLAPGKPCRIAGSDDIAVVDQLLAEPRGACARGMARYIVVRTARALQTFSPVELLPLPPSTPVRVLGCRGALFARISSSPCYRAGEVEVTVAGGPQHVPVEELALCDGD
jgi:hypothetical protein